MSRLLLDTSAYSAIQRGEERLREPIREAQEICLSPIVLGELGAGFLKGGKPAENEALPPDGNINVVRVSESVVLMQKPIPFRK